MRAANSAALAALPIAIVATGTPGGICTIESSESSPSSVLPRTGTPITGSLVLAAVIPGRCAAPPAPAIRTRSPRAAAPFSVAEQQVGRAVRGDDAHLVRDAQLAQRRRRGPHRLEVRAAAHDDADAGSIVHTARFARGQTATSTAAWNGPPVTTPHRAAAFCSASTTGRGRARWRCGRASTPARSIATSRSIAGLGLRARPLLPAVGGVPARAGSHRPGRARAARHRAASAPTSRAAHDADVFHRTHERRQLAARLDARLPTRRQSAFARSPAAASRRYGIGDFYTGPLLEAQRFAARTLGGRYARHPRDLRLGPRQRVLQPARAVVAAGRGRVERRADRRPARNLGPAGHRRHPRRGPHVRPQHPAVVDLRALGRRNDARLLRLQRVRARPPRPRRCPVPLGASTAVVRAQAAAVLRVRQSGVPAGGSSAAAVRLPRRGGDGGRTRRPCSSGCTPAARSARCGGAGPTTRRTSRDEPPFDRAPHELRFGIARADGSLKPVARRARRVRARAARPSSTNPHALRRRRACVLCRRCRPQHGRRVRCLLRVRGIDAVSRGRASSSPAPRPASGARSRSRPRAPASRSSRSRGAASDSRRSRARATAARSRPLTINVAAPGAPKRIVAAALTRFGRIDVLVNNAGGVAVGPIVEQSDDALREQFATHVLAPLALVREALAALRRSAATCSSSVRASRACRSPAWAPIRRRRRRYAWRRAIARIDLRKDGVAVTYVDPSAVDTEFMRRPGMRGAPSALTDSAGTRRAQDLARDRAPAGGAQRVALAVAAARPRRDLCRSDRLGARALPAPRRQPAARRDRHSPSRSSRLRPRRVNTASAGDYRRRKRRKRGGRSTTDALAPLAHRMERLKSVARVRRRAVTAGDDARRGGRGAALGRDAEQERTRADAGGARRARRRRPARAYRRRRLPRPLTRAAAR